MLERVFLGWERPGLLTGAEYLLQRYTSANCCALADAVVVLPGGRAQRRLLDVLASRSAEEGSVLLPPRMVTQGHLFEELYPPLAPQARPLETELAWVQALRRAEPSRLKRLIPYPPGASDLPGWLVLARDCARLHQEISAAGLTFTGVAEYCGRAGAHYSDAIRWQVFAQLYTSYLEVLAEAGREDGHETRQRYLADLPQLPRREIILFCTPDLNQVVQRLLRECGARVTALIQAPEEAVGGFDELGCLVPEFWSGASLFVRTEDLRIVDRPQDQAAAVIDSIAELNGTYPAEAIVIGLGDPEHGAAVERALALCGLPARAAQGSPAGATGPGLLLRSLADYLGDASLDHFAALLRHSDLESWLVRKSALRPAAGRQAALEEVGRIIELLDAYALEHLPLRMGEFWASGKAAEPLREVHAAIEALLIPLRSDTLPLPEWSARLTEVLGQIYAGRELDRTQPEAQQLIRVLEALGGLLREQHGLDAGGPLTLSLQSSEAIRFTLGRLQELTLPEEGGEPAIELLGWLELYLDDAPALIVTGLNDGKLPESVNGDAYLPDRLRRELGLLDNRRRYARDALVLRTLGASRAALRLISGRRSERGEPLTPSRLLFACDDPTVVERALAFYGAEAEAGTAARPLLVPGCQGSVGIPRPIPPAAPLSRLRVTAFRDYLACPYRFYLRHVRKLVAVEEALTEMNGALFGQLVHEVLNAFACSAQRDAEDVEAIRAELREGLEREAGRLFGPARPPAVEIQLYQAGRRLDAFAVWQASAAAEGWRIESAEQGVEAQLQIDNDSFTVHGRMDRIDRHPDGRRRVIDYKTADSASTPDKIHRVRREGVVHWVDLQLPLYRRLAEALKLDLTNLELGYVLLPKDVGEVRWRPAEWSPAEFGEAEEEAVRVIRAIRAGQFWPPNPLPSPFADGLEAICLDRCTDRRRWLAGGVA